MRGVQKIKPKKCHVLFEMALSLHKGLVVLFDLISFLSCESNCKHRFEMLLKTKNLPFDPDKRNSVIFRMKANNLDTSYKCTHPLMLETFLTQPRMAFAKS